MNSHVLTGTIGGPVEDLTLNVGRVTFAGTDAVAVPAGVTDWTHFHGALLATIVRNNAGTLANGSASMIAPGLAVTATHTVREYTDSWTAGDAVILCVGPTPEGLVLWRVVAIDCTEADDIAYLSLVLESSPPSSPMGIRLFQISTRSPGIGERVYVLGFRLDTIQDELTTITLAGDLFAAAGAVAAIHHPTRDSFLMPYPTIEIACGSLGAMSGGPVVDDEGSVLGIVGRGFETADGEGPTSAPWIIGGLDRPVSSPWPQDLYPKDIRVLDIEDDLLRILGRDKLIRTSEGLLYTRWT